MYHTKSKDQVVFIFFVLISSGLNQPYDHNADHNAEDIKYYKLGGEQYIEVSREYTFEINCYYPSNTKWYFYGDQTASNLDIVNFDYFNTEMNKLRITQATPANIGKYECVYMKNFNLSIVPKYAQYDDVTKHVGSTVIFDCIGDVTWSYNGGPVPNNAKVDEEYTSLITFSSLILHDAKYENSGTYTCYGHKKWHVLVSDRLYRPEPPSPPPKYNIVQGMPMVTPNRKQAIIGSEVEFICLYNKAAKWEFSGSVLTPNNVYSTHYKINSTESNNIYDILVLTIQNVLPHNLGTYTCREVVIYNITVQEPTERVLDKDDKDNVEEALKYVQSQWKGIGTLLHLRASLLNNFERLDPATATEKMVEAYLAGKYNKERFGPPTWKKIVKAVKSPAGGNNNRLSMTIADKYVNGFDNVQGTERKETLYEDKGILTIDIVAVIGAEIKMYCDSYGRGEWTFNGHHHLPDDLQLDRLTDDWMYYQELTIPNAQIHNSGLYICNSYMSALLY